MSEARYNIMFDGQLMPGAELDTVKDNLAQLFKSDRARIETLFHGASVALKRDLSLEQAEQYERALQKAGVNVHKQAQARALSLSLVDTDERPEEPVTTQAQMRCPKCHHEQRKAPECSACGVIVEKFLARQATQYSVEASSASPYAAPRSNVIEDDAEYAELKVFSTHGRIGRLRYLGWSFMALLCCAVAYAFTAGLMIASPILGALLLAPVVIGFMVVTIMIGVQRLHDIGWSGWLWLLNLVPVVGTVLAFILILMPGNLGSNLYGPPPPPNSPAIKWLVIGSLLGLIILTIIMLAVVAPAVSELAGSAEHMQGLMQPPSE